MPHFSSPRWSRTAAFTLVETAVAGALLTLFLSSLFALNATVMRMLRSADETASASQELQYRVEQLRLANWLQVSDPNYVQNTLLATPTDAAGDLPDFTESIAAASYQPGAPGSTSFRFLSSGGTVTSLGGDGSNLTSQPMIEFTVTVSWTSWGGRTRVREINTVVSKWGISK